MANRKQVLEKDVEQAQGKIIDTEKPIDDKHDTALDEENLEIPTFQPDLSVDCNTKETERRAYYPSSQNKPQPECRDFDRRLPKPRPRVLINEADEEQMRRSLSPNGLGQNTVHQSSESYLYVGNPLLDARFQQLVMRLVPLGNRAQEKQLFGGRKDPNSRKRGDAICFKDICLNETCRLVYKIMNISNN